MKTFNHWGSNYSLGHNERKTFNISKNKFQIKENLFWRPLGLENPTEARVGPRISSAATFKKTSATRWGTQPTDQRQVSSRNHNTSSSKLSSFVKNIERAIKAVGTQPWF